MNKIIKKEVKIVEKTVQESDDDEVDKEKGSSIIREIMI